MVRKIIVNADTTHEKQLPTEMRKWRWCRFKNPAAFRSRGTVTSEMFSNRMSRGPVTSRSAHGLESHSTGPRLQCMQCQRRGSLDVKADKRSAHTPTLCLSLLRPRSVFTHTCTASGFALARSGATTDRCVRLNGLNGVRSSRVCGSEKRTR